MRWGVKTVPELVLNWWSLFIVVGMLGETYIVVSVQAVFIPVRCGQVPRPSVYEKLMGWSKTTVTQIRVIILVVSATH